MQEWNNDTKNFYTTLSKGEVLDEDLILIDPGFHYKGKVQLYADTEGLVFNGEVSPSITESLKNRSWVDYSGRFLPGDDFRLALGNKDSPPNTILYNLNNNQEMFFSFFDSNEKINAGRSNKSSTRLLERYTWFLILPLLSRHNFIILPMY